MNANLLLKSNDKDDKQECIVTSAFFSFLLVMIVMIFWRNVIPYSPAEVWSMGEGGTIAGWIAGWPIYLWSAFLVTFLCGTSKEDPAEILGGGFLISALAGIIEEICFRWWFFYGAIMGVKFLSFITCGLVGWFYTGLLCPIANFFTLGLLHNQLTANGFHWAVGAAIISTNGKFRNGHAYQGWFGFVDAWFFGMFAFYIMFHYGLMAAILVHFTFNMIQFTIAAMKAGATPRYGYA